MQTAMPIAIFLVSGSNTPRRLSRSAGLSKPASIPPEGRVSRRMPQKVAMMQIQEFRQRRRKRMPAEKRPGPRPQ